MSACQHDWEVSERWGVIIGVSRCKRCDKLSTSDDFPSPPKNPCRNCGGTGQEVTEHWQFGPQVDPCPDCDGTGRARA